MDLKRPLCHKDRLYYAKNLCKSCYNAQNKYFSKSSNITSQVLFNYIIISRRNK